jgi:hypothetical protein
MTTMERRVQMLEQRWIAVRDRQARLLAEAAAERLVRAARNGHASDGSTRTEVIALAQSEARRQARMRLAAAAASLSADATLTTCECSEA